MFGRVSFNHRILLDYKSNRHNRNILTLECYDRDFLLSNDFIGSVELDLSLPIQDTLIKNKRTSISSRYYDFLKENDDNWAKAQIEFHEKKRFWSSQDEEDESKS